MKIRYLEYLKATIFSMLFLTLPFALITQFIFQEAGQTSDKTVYGVLGIVVDLVESFLVLTLLGYGVKKVLAGPKAQSLSVGKHYKKHFRDIIIESLRALGRIAVGFLMFIFPGFIRMIQYYLVPYIVQFDPDYQEGKIDILDEAPMLLKGHLLKFSLVLGLTQTVGFVLQIATVRFNLFTTPVPWILFFMAEVLLQITVFWVFYNYYTNLKALQKR